MNSYKQKPFPEIAGESHRSLQSVVVTEKTEKLLRRWQEKLIEKKKGYRNWACGEAQKLNWVLRRWA